MGNDKRLLIKIILDIVLLCIVGFPILFLYLFGQPYKRGFFCDDDSIRHPFQNSTVPNYMLYFLGMAVPITVMIISEIIHQNKSIPSRVLFGHRIPNWLWNAYCAIGVFGFGAACSQLLTDLGKYSIGRLRPHFIDTCQPNVNCSLPENLHRYIVQFECLKNSSKEMRLSFPSGHSSFMTYTMLYLVIYLQVRFTWEGSKLLRHFLQFAAIMLAAGTCLSRVSDYKHHPTDVLAGAILGAIVAIVIARFVSDLCIKQQNSPKSFDSDNELDARNGTTHSNP